jgi:hypothetical protein
MGTAEDAGGKAAGRKTAVKIANRFGPVRSLQHVEQSEIVPGEHFIIHQMMIKLRRKIKCIHCE